MLQFFPEFRQPFLCVAQIVCFLLQNEMIFLKKEESIVCADYRHVTNLSKGTELVVQFSAFTVTKDILISLIDFHQLHLSPIEYNIHKQTSEHLLYGEIGLQLSLIFILYKVIWVQFSSSLSPSSCQLFSRSFGRHT